MVENAKDDPEETKPKCCLIIVMVENTKDDLGETKPNFVEKSGDVKPPKVEAKPTLLELPSMLKLLNMSTPVSSHFMRTKLTQLGFFFLPTTLNGKIGMTCLIGYVVKKIRRDLQLLHQDQV